MSTKWSDAMWRDPVVQVAERPHRPASRRHVVEAVAAWLAIPAICWGALGALIAYLLGWLG